MEQNPQVWHYDEQNKRESSLTCSAELVGGNIPFTRAWREVYDFVSRRRFTTISPCKLKIMKVNLTNLKHFGNFYQLFFLFRKEGFIYPGINNEDFSYRDSNLKVADFISIPISKTSIEWIAIRRKKCLYALHALKFNLSLRTSWPCRKH